jgi:hypothetical protein
VAARNDAARNGANLRLDGCDAYGVKPLTTSSSGPGLRE